MPATFDAAGRLLTPARAECRTRDIALAEFRTLGVKMTPELKSPSYQAAGINVWAPPIFALLALDGTDEIVASPSARAARAAGLEIITWTLERSGILGDGANGFCYQTIDAAVRREGDMLRVLDVLAKDAGIRGIFSDWPATVSFHANCTGLQ